MYERASFEIIRFANEFRFIEAIHMLTTVYMYGTSQFIQFKSYLQRKVMFTVLA